MTGERTDISIVATASLHFVDWEISQSYGGVEDGEDETAES